MAEETAVSRKDEPLSRLPLFCFGERIVWLPFSHYKIDDALILVHIPLLEGLYDVALVGAVLILVISSIVNRNLAIDDSPPTAP